MANIRILYENQAKRASISASSSAGGVLVPANLLNDIKTSIHRSTGTSVTYTLTWPTAVNLNMAALAFANLTAGATMRARVFTFTNDSVPVRDSGIVTACAYAPLGQFGWGLTALGVNAFRFGGGSYGRVYFTGATGRKLELTISDPTNASGFIEAGCLVAGMYWEPECNPDYGAQLGVAYGTKHEESEAGDLRTERRPKRRTMDLNLGWIKKPIDQLAMHEIMMQGMETAIWVSLYPEHSNPVLEQRHQMYCKLAGDTSMSHPSFGIFSAPLNVLEI